MTPGWENTQAMGSLGLVTQNVLINRKGRLRAAKLSWRPPASSAQGFMKIQQREKVRETQHITDANLSYE